jgi:hypothetical protein
MPARTPATDPVPFYLSTAVSDAVDEVLNEDAADAALLTKLAQTRAFLVKQINDLDTEAISIATKRQARGLPATPAPAPLPAAPVPAATLASAPAAASTPVTPTPEPAPADPAPAVPVAPATTAPAAASPASDPAPATPAASATPASATAATVVLPAPAPAAASTTPKRDAIKKAAYTPFKEHPFGAFIGLGLGLLASAALVVFIVPMIGSWPLWAILIAAFFLLLIVVLLLTGGVALGAFLAGKASKTHIEPAPVPAS